MKGYYKIFEPTYVSKPNVMLYTFTLWDDRAYSVSKFNENHKCYNVSNLPTGFIIIVKYEMRTFCICNNM